MEHDVRIHLRAGVLPGPMRPDAAGCLTQDHYARLLDILDRAVGLCPHWSASRPRPGPVTCRDPLMARARDAIRPDGPSRVFPLDRLSEGPDCRV
ncbi:hypothetical protein GGQ69_001259 [Micrococcus sp. TA1]|jgi:hypothetical protein|nr:hypothetical protein [Micrococcus sp. TA1]